jgi:hypothetical protein
MTHDEQGILMASHCFVMLPVCLGEPAGTQNARDFMGSNILLGEDPRCRGVHGLNSDIPRTSGRPWA